MTMIKRKLVSAAIGLSISSFAGAYDQVHYEVSGTFTGTKCQLNVGTNSLDIGNIYPLPAGDLISKVSTSVEFTCGGSQYFKFDVRYDKTYSDAGPSFYSSAYNNDSTTFNPGNKTTEYWDALLKTGSLQLPAMWLNHMHPANALYAFGKVETLTGDPMSVGGLVVRAKDGQVQMSSGGSFDSANFAVALVKGPGNWQDLVLDSVPVSTNNESAFVLTTEGTAGTIGDTTQNTVVALYGARFNLDFDYIIADGSTWVFPDVSNGVVPLTATIVVNVHFI